MQISFASTNEMDSVTIRTYPYARVETETMFLHVILSTGELHAEQREVDYRDQLGFHILFKLTWIGE